LSEPLGSAIENVVVEPIWLSTISSWYLLDLLTVLRAIFMLLQI